jgi:hypothetical protein
MPAQSFLTDNVVARQDVVMRHCNALHGQMIGKPRGADRTTTLHGLHDTSKRPRNTCDVPARSKHSSTEAL